MWNEFKDVCFEIRKSQIPWHGKYYLVFADNLYVQW